MTDALQGAPTATFHDKLRRAWRRADSPLCVGLDPRRDRLPGRCRRAPQPLFAFCREIAHATADLACAFKPQAACFAAERAEPELEALVGMLRRDFPDTPVILDAKRGDVGHTAELYAREAFEVYDADAVTVSPYLGWDAVEPFLGWRERGVAVLCHTSNPGSPWLQEHPPAEPVYLRVAERAAAACRGDLMLVAGATFPERLGAIRSRAPGLPLLVPGVGAQGGDLEAAFAHGMDADGGGMVVNVSRGVIFAGEGDGFAAAAERSARALRDAMRRARDSALAARAGGSGVR